MAHPHRPKSIPVAHKVAEIAQAKGLTTWLEETWLSEPIPSLVAESDLVIAIGGDGAMLHAARLCAPHQVPVFGLNMGNLGFLTETNPEGWESALNQILIKDYWVEKRLMIRGEVWRDGKCITQEEALNDVVISRGALAKAIRLDAYIQNEWVTTYNADGLVIATPTGSTAYSLAVGGPILPPELNNILMVPVAPHLSMERPIVLAQGVTLKIVVSPLTKTDTVLSIDGELQILLQNNDEIQVYASKNRSQFIRLQGRNYFFRSIMDRLEPRYLPRHPPHENGDGSKKNE